MEYKTATHHCRCTVGQFEAVKAVAEKTGLSDADIMRWALWELCHRHGVDYPDIVVINRVKTAQDDTNETLI